MSPKEVSKMAVLPTHVTTQRTSHVQTSGIFKLPIELFPEIFSHLYDHRRYIHDTTDSERGGSYRAMKVHQVERSTVIRKLTMTCWALRNALLPVLWRNTEGCVIESASDDGKPRKTYGLYAQCVYLLSNPTIATHVRILSVDLSFKDAPKNLMMKFVDVLVRLPNLRTLELLHVTLRSPITRALKRKCAKFPSIREITVCNICTDFVKTCPNLESVTFRHGFGHDSSEDLSLCGAGLKRVKGVMTYSSRSVEFVVQNCPKLQEISLYSVPDDWSGSGDIIKHLRQAKHLSVVEIRLTAHELAFEDPSFVDSRLSGHRDSLDEDPSFLGRRKAWKAGLIDLLKNSPSKDRKFLRWSLVQADLRPVDNRYVRQVVESEVLEVLPESSP